ncbi:amino acid ABC transporter ATP-binding protein [Fructobacillus ficulneus]|uniref:ABC transporter, ATP-binding protein n=1 Tax=Fructobacillus ficulneus TaxID=157463 RepID=A0A0K8MFF5_9LACO|nr:amino acid ABC transporter ATP-binding protein [Fructobacillus ficulneus]GAO99240.1 ABC transporter, ATP-binding protein [Fructobacillus ficulneus]
MTLLNIKNLTKKINDHTILNNINFEINEGDVIAIIGPSGSGKTTFLKNIIQLESSDSGSLTLKDRELNLNSLNSKDKLWLRRQIAMVFQNYALFKNKTALENITEGLIYGRGVDEKTAHTVAIKELQSVNLLEKKDSYPHELSGGQQQRIGIARATALNPEIILFDEPTSALDPELVGTVIDDMKRLADQKQTMVVVTHLMSFAQQVANKVIFFDGGEILASGTPDEIFYNSNNQRINQFLSAVARDQ